jgi:hypothetical protein
MVARIVRLVRNDDDDDDDLRIMQAMDPSSVV